MQSSYPIPSEFTDEDKWFKFFTKKSLVALMVSGIIAYGIIWAARFLGILIPGILVGALLVIIVTGSTMLPYPETEYMRGGGLTLDVLLARRIIRKVNACLYVKGYSADEEV